LRKKDQEIFRDTARDQNVWLLVRLTNPQSLKWAGEDNYLPKPISCKAKTANIIDTDARYKIAGLVADPYKHGNNFKKPHDAREDWDKFSAAHLDQDYRQTGNGRDGYSVDIDSKSVHYFCAKRYGKYIHSDYDLLDIIDAENPRMNEIIEEILDGARHAYNPRFPDIQRILNTRMDTPMVQHAGEAQFTGLSEQPIHVFFPRVGPKGQDCSRYEPLIWLNKATALRWYKDWLDGRQAAKPPAPDAPRRQYPTNADVINVDFRTRQRL
jgi:hypothetical protein